MLGSWLSNKSITSGSRKDAAYNDQSIASTTHSETSLLPGSIPQQDSLIYTDSERDKLSTAPILTTPHDAAVNEMNEKIRKLELAGAPRLSRQPSSGTEKDGNATHGAEEQPKTRLRLPDNFYDPFTGQSIGNYAPGEFSESEDDLWTHLGRIRGLQCQIAMMHSQMEGLGTTERSLRAEQPIGDDEPMNFEEDAKEAKDEEFRRLADRFNGRKDAIDAIMAKLEALSHAINDFHYSREPIFRLGSRRSTVSEQDSGRGKTTVSTSPADKLDKQESSHTPTRILKDNVSLKETPESMPRSLET